jgi:hypothetical protein
VFEGDELTYAPKENHDVNNVENWSFAATEDFATHQKL